MLLGGCMLLLLLLLQCKFLVARTHGLVAGPMRRLMLLAAVMRDTARGAFHQRLVITHAVRTRYGCSCSCKLLPSAPAALHAAARDAARRSFFRQYQTACCERFGCKDSETLAGSMLQLQACAAEQRVDVGWRLGFSVSICGRKCLHAKIHQLRCVVKLQFGQTNRSNGIAIVATYCGHGGNSHHSPANASCMRLIIDSGCSAAAHTRRLDCCYILL